MLKGVQPLTVVDDLCTKSYIVIGPVKITVYVHCKMIA